MVVSSTEGTRTWDFLLMGFDGLDIADRSNQNVQNCPSLVRPSLIDNDY